MGHACHRAPDDPSRANAGPEQISWSLRDFIDFPDYVPQPEAPIPDNPLRPEKIALGRKLFYDPILSGDNTLNCASCHRQSAAFSDPGQAQSVGANGARTARNAPGLFNLAWHPAFFWDGGVGNLEAQAFGPITEHTEMHQDLPRLMEELAAHPDYPGLFEEAFQDDSLRVKYILYALAQFERTMVSFNSRYDQWRQGQVQLTEPEQRGYQLFTQPVSAGGAGCASCHEEPLFTDFSYRNNGLDRWAHFARNDADVGRGRITTKRADTGCFKVPSLRNVALTPPYMHDGRFNDLAAVIDHYQNGVHQTPSLAEELHPHAEGALKLSESDQEAIIAFLNTLSDPQLIQDPAYAP